MDFNIEQQKWSATKINLLSHMNEIISCWPEITILNKIFNFYSKLWPTVFFQHNKFWMMNNAFYVKSYVRGSLELLGEFFIYNILKIHQLIYTLVFQWTINANCSWICYNKSEMLALMTCQNLDLLELKEMIFAKFHIL